MPSAARSSEQRRAHASHGCGDVSHDERRIQPEHAVARASQHRVTARIRSHPLRVTPAIDLNHEPRRGRIEIRNEPPKQRHLPPKYNAQPPPADPGPKQLFRASLRSAHATSPLVEHYGPCGVPSAKQGLVVGSSHAPKRRRRRASPPPYRDAPDGAGTPRAPSRMTRTDNKPEPHSKPRSSATPSPARAEVRRLRRRTLRRA